MKKLAIATVILLLFIVSGCSSSASGVQNLPEKSVKTYYEALAKGDFNQAVDQLSLNNLKLTNMSREQWVSNIKEVYHKNSIKWSDYQISEIKELDSTHKRVKVFYKQNVSGKDTSGIDDFLLVQENGKWMLDYSMVLSSSPINGEKVISKNGGTIKIGSIVAHKTVDGIILTCNITNNTNNILQTGWSDSAVIEIVTDKGSWSMQMGTRAKILPGKTEAGSFQFNNAEGVLKVLTMKGIRFLDDRGLPINLESHILAFHM